MAQEIQIVKASGEQQAFDIEKLRDSLKRSGAGENMTESVISEITKDLRDGTTTKDIYSRAFELVRGDKPVAIRYSLRQAIMDLGPTGFPFEKFLGEVMKAQGFTNVQTGVMLYGYCVTHEVDILATHEKGNKHIFVEAKYHNSQSIKTDLKVALYVKARFDDLHAVHKRKEGVAPIIHEGWLVTNTKLTSKARQYGRCAGLKLIGWNYPKRGNLQDMILQSGVHPISALTTISGAQKRIIFEHGVVLCRDLAKREDLLREIGIRNSDVAEVMEEIHLLCGGALLQPRNEL